MFGDYSEDKLIENTAVEVFKHLGYEHLNCFQEVFGRRAAGRYSVSKSVYLGRETSSEVVLVPRLRKALVKLNPGLPAEAVERAIEELCRDRSTLNPVSANQEVYRLLRDGVKVPVRQPDGREETETLRVVDFDRPEKNDFFLAQQFWVTGEMYKRRADLVGFINGLPLIFIELKAAHKSLKNAFKDNLTDYLDTIPHIFWYNAFIILSNGSESRAGTISAGWDHFSEWKKISSEGESGVVSLDTIIKGLCEKSRFLDLLENFVLYQGADKGGPSLKILAKNHQYLGVNNAIESFRQINENQGKLGVFWHTQGSGKSYSMIFFSQKILRKFEGNYTFVIVTDRKELDEQIYGNFAGVGAVTEEEVHATSAEHLHQLLKEDHRNIFTLIHKFWAVDGPVSNRSDIIVITDEAHRTQYDELARKMRTALPNAAFIAFTGTPLIKVGEERTRDTFGDYVSVYNFKQSADDGATVPLYYENRIPELQLTNEDLNEDLQQIVEEAMLDDKQEEKLVRVFARQYHLITRDKRLERIAEDIVEHFMGRGYAGKAMIVAIDKSTAVKMYDKVQEYWDKYLDRLKNELRSLSDESERDILETKIKFMEETDMAVVVSQEQNEIKKFKGLGLEIGKHRERMVKEDLATKFKDTDNSFRIVFVCAMWMTGFDAKSVSTIYIDKPLRNHTLMQTIARANRVFKEKPNGLIVDYVGVFREMEKALAIYGSAYGGGVKPGEIPVVPMAELVLELEKAVAAAVEFCEEVDINLQKIIEADKLEKIKLLDEAVDTFLVSEDTRKKYLNLADRVYKLYKAILPDPAAGTFTPLVVLLKVIAEKIRSLQPTVDISGVLKEVEQLLDESIAAEGYVIDPSRDYVVDLTKIDFEKLKKQFETGRKHIQIEALKNAILGKLDKMIRHNKLRINLKEKLEQLIEEYNSGAINIDVFFERLREFAQELNEEEKRTIAENLDEEELALFDLLKKPDLSNKEKDQVKKAAKDLLDVLKREKLVLDWRKRQQTRAAVRLTIEDTLDGELPESYTPDIYLQKCDDAYQHVYESYYGAGESIYTAVA